MSQTLEAKISESVKQGIEMALSPALRGVLGGILMPVIPSALAMLNGWTWKVESVSQRATLTRGAGPVNIINPIQNEKGWLNSFFVLFSDPQTEMVFTCDNWNFTFSPFLVNTYGFLNPNNVVTYNMVYNPATPLGPLYGVAWTPSQFWPYITQVTWQAQHPAAAPSATSQLVAAFLGRHYIRDEKQFYESIIREGRRQTAGRVEVPLR